MHGDDERNLSVKQNGRTHAKTSYRKGAAEQQWESDSFAALM